MKAQQLAASIVLIALAVISSSAGHAGPGIIRGVVVDEHQNPVSRVQVHAFPAPTPDSQMKERSTVPFSTRATGTAATDAEGRFQITGLEFGQYLVAADVRSSTSGVSHPPIYATTFYPSTIDYEAAALVSPLADFLDPIRIELVRVNGARVTGSVSSGSGRSVSGMDVRLFRRFGGFGSESPAATVGADGAFEIAGLPPGWYRLTVAARATTSSDRDRQFASKVIEVQGTDINGLSLVLGTGASISGRVAAEPGAGVTSAVGMRIAASLAETQYSAEHPATATVASDWSFQMTGLSGSYSISAGADRPPFVKATRMTIDGRETALDGIELTDGRHEVVVFVAPREQPAPAVDPTLSTTALVEQFRGEKYFWRQFTIAQEIVKRRDLSVLSSLAAWLTHDDRHVRGNVAFVFARLGDPRGFQVITETLTDRSDRPEGQGIPGVSGDGRYRVERQIATDRYYAAHLLGDLRDPRAVPILVPLLKDNEVHSIVPWALGEIGDASAIGPLIDALDEDDPSARVMAIYALTTLKAKDAIPRLRSLVDDHRTSNFGAQVSVADAARAALDTLR
jgi:HEAT repeat protein